MAEATQLSAEKEDKNLHQLFLEAWTLFEELEETSLPTNSTEFQNKVKTSMNGFEKATNVVSQIGMFSPNELIDEVTTESLQFMLLPFFLGKLSLKLSQDRLEVLNVAEIYFKDYLQRCQDYELCEVPSTNKTVANSSGDNGDSSTELAELMRAAHSRNDKIAQFRRKKELEDYIKQMREAVKNSSVDEEIKREFFIKFIKKSIIDANEELNSLQLEKQMVEMRKMHMSAGVGLDAIASGVSSGASAAHRHAQHGGHGHSHQHSAPKPKPLQPFIITRNATQKAVFGMGYPSLPILTVDEFYSQRVRDGIFPDEEKVAQMNQAQAIAAAQDPNEKEDEEKCVEEVQIENDDPEYLSRMRRMDEYKDVVRRGDGNRHNRS